MKIILRLRNIFIIILLQICLGAGLICQNLKFEHLASENELSNGSIFDIFKDSKGFMWFCTDKGLNKYDGFKFTVFNTVLGDSNSLSYFKTRKIIEDKYGRLWIATHEGLNAFDRETEQFIRFYHNPQKSNSLGNSNIIDLLYDSKGNLWVLSYNQLNRINSNELVKKDIREIKFERYNASNKNKNSLSSNAVQAIFEDKKQNIWIATKDGFLNKYNSQTNDFKSYRIEVGKGLEEIIVLKIKEDELGNFWLLTQYSGIIKWNRKTDTWNHIKVGETNQPSINSNSIWDIYFGNKGEIWIATDGGGINIYDTKTGKVRYCTYDPTHLNGLSTNAIFRIMDDNAGTLWIGSFNGGVFKFVANKNNFGHHTAEPNANSLSNKNITSFCENGDGQIWIGTDGGGLNLFDKSNGTYKAYKAARGMQNCLSSNAILSICKDNAGIIWIGTWQGGLNRYDKRNNQFIWFKNNPLNSNSIASNDIFKVFEDSKGNLWIGSLQNGLDLFDRKRNKFIHYVNNEKDSNSISDNIIFSIYEDSKHRLWIGNNIGVDMLNLNEVDFSVDSPELKFKHFNNPGNEKAIVYSIIEDYRGYLWFGNERSGINILNPTTSKFDRLNIDNGLPSNQISGILEDADRNIWISTNKGLSKYNVNDGKIRNFSVADGLQAMEFNRACMKAANGQLFFGGINGFNAFFPKQIATNTLKPRVEITEIKVFNKPVNIGDKINGRIILNKAIGETKEIHLTYRENFFSFEFAALDFTSPEKNQYAYFMEGFDKKWNVIGNKHEATYTNLNPGEYVFTVIASNNDGNWNETGTSLRIVISPPFWKTIWMYLIYFLGLIGILYLVYNIIVNREKLKSQIELERLELRKTKEISKLKLNFFTNISHEFRTPLTLLLGPLDALINEGEGNNHMKQYFAMMHRNALQLKRLINQLLDFRAIEEGGLKNEPSFNDLNAFIKTTAASFEFLAKKRNINFQVQCKSNNVLAWFDADKLEKVLLNLISNAFKYTPDNGNISVIAETSNWQGQEVIQIKIIDTGLGIPSESIEKIFSVFYRIGDRKSFVSESTGIGLSLTKELVEIMKGAINVESKVGEGSTFIVTLPLEGDKQQVLDFVTGVPSKKESNLTIPEFDEKLDNTEDPTYTSAQQSILIVEDNMDVINFLRSELVSHYKVYEAINGAEGFEKAISLIPDIIISDIMMPEMNGRELCSKLKQDIRTSHIPIVLLTAQQSDEHRIEGFVAGADEYISKPFNALVLKARVKNLLDNRARLRELFGKEHNYDIALASDNQTDRDFLQKVIQIIENNIANKDFDISLFANELNLGRSIFFKKIKALTNQTPYELVMGKRMKKASELLLKSNKTISEITFEVGFTEPSNFTRSFSKQHGMSPSKYSEIHKG